MQRSALHEQPNGCEFLCGNDTGNVIQEKRKEVRETQQIEQQFGKALEFDRFFVGAQDCLRVTEDVLAKRIEKVI